MKDEIPPKHVVHFIDLNKLYFVATCWIIIDTVKNDFSFKDYIL